MGDLPSGVVTFLSTDVQGSTRPWEQSPELMAKGLAQHDEAINEAVVAHNGIPVKARGEGDGWSIVFSSALDMGEHGLRDLTRPEHVYQLNIDDLPSTFPPLLSLNAVPNNLPIQLTDFVGTEAEPIRDIASGAVSDVRSRLDDGSYRQATDRERAMSFDATVNELLGRTGEAG